MLAGSTTVWLGCALVAGIEEAESRNIVDGGTDAAQDALDESDADDGNVAVDATGDADGATCITCSDAANGLWQTGDMPPLCPNDDGPYQKLIGCACGMDVTSMGCTLVTCSKPKMWNSDCVQAIKTWCSAELAACP